MNTIPRLVLLAISLFALAGCLQIDTLISVRADGSGTVREQVRLSDEAVEMIRETEQMGQASGDQGGQPGLIDRAKLEQRASAMGPGVELVSAQELPGSDGFGYEAVWSFEDINTLRVEQRAEDAVSQGDAVEEEPGTSPGAVFRLEPGSPAVLHVVSTLAGEGETPAPAAPSGDEQVPPEMIREMFQGMRFTIAIEVEGTIVETNASHLSGSRVTLFELDFDRLLQNPEALQLLSATDAPDPMQMKDALRGLPGITVETQTDLRVAFVSDDASMAAVTESSAKAPEVPPMPELVAEAPEVAPMPTPVAEAPEVEPMPELVADAPQLAPVADVPEPMPMAETSTPVMVEELPEVAPMPVLAAEAPVPEPVAVMADMVPEVETAAAMPETAPVPEPAAQVSVAASVAASRSATSTPTGSIAGYSWRNIALDDLAGQRFKLVSLTDAGGLVTKGMVMTVDAHSVRLRRASMDGGGFVDLPLESLRAVSVFEQGS